LPFRWSQSPTGCAPHGHRVDKQRLAGMPPGWDLSFEPGAQDGHDVVNLRFTKSPTATDPVPFLQAFTTARARSMLGDEHGMAPQGRLAAIIRRGRRGQPLPDELLGMSANHIRPFRAPIRRIP